jgi:hypothetical protein
MGQALPQVPCTLHQSVFLGALRQGRSLRIHFQESWQPRTLRHRFFIFNWPRGAEHPIAVAYQKRSAVNRVFRGTGTTGPTLTDGTGPALRARGRVRSRLQVEMTAGKDAANSAKKARRTAFVALRRAFVRSDARQVGTTALTLSYRANSYDCPAVRSKMDRKKRTVSCIQGIIDNRMMTMAVSPIVPGDGPGRSPAGSTSVWRLGLRLRHINPPVFGRDGQRSWLGKVPSALHISRRPTPLRSSSSIQGEVGEARRSSGATRRRASPP